MSSPSTCDGEGDRPKGGGGEADAVRPFTGRGPSVSCFATATSPSQVDEEEALLNFQPLKLPPDQLFHNLIRPAKNPRHPRTAPCFGDGIFVHIARTAVQLQAFVHHFPLQFGVP
jgi:hypothetical protein